MLERSINSSSRLLSAILMQNQAPGATGFRQFEFQCGVDATVGPSRGGVRIDFLGGLIGNANHQMAVNVTNRENKIRSQLITTN